MEIPFAIDFLSSFPDFQHESSRCFPLSKSPQGHTPTSSHDYAISILTQFSFILNGFSKKLFLSRLFSQPTICVDFPLKMC